MMRTIGLVLLIAFGAVAGSVTVLRAQDPRDALVARAFNEFDPARRQQLLITALNPNVGPTNGAWQVGVQLLAQTLLEDHQDSAAAVWFRWALRLAPDFQPDTVQFLPAVIASYRSARDYVARTRSPGDSLAVTTWPWPTEATTTRQSHIQVSAGGIAAPVHVEIRGVGVVAAGANVGVNPGSYDISASAPGSDSSHVTREALPGITTVIEYHLRLTPKPVAAAPPKAAPPPEEKKGKKFPVIPVVGAAVGVGVLAAVLAGGGSSTPSTPTTGSLTVTIPN